MKRHWANFLNWARRGERRERAGKFDHIFSSHLTTRSPEEFAKIIARTSIVGLLQRQEQDEGFCTPSREKGGRVEPGSGINVCGVEVLHGCSSGVRTRLCIQHRAHFPGSQFTSFHLLPGGIQSHDQTLSPRLRRRRLLLGCNPSPRISCRYFCEKIFCRRF